MLPNKRIVLKLLAGWLVVDVVPQGRLDTKEA